jgi:class 3 adenylate cyclase
MEFLGDSMTTQEVKRKLAAILSADVKGYSRLMREDEKGTAYTLSIAGGYPSKIHVAWVS